MSQRYEYQQLSAWFGVGRGFPKVRAQEEAGWELVAILPVCLFGGTMSYTFVMRRPAQG